MNLELSICLIVRNEEPYLKGCVESFGAIDDELIIVDTGSTDGTIDVARELLRNREGRLEHYAWRDDFAAARNYACSLARAPWILMVDADEYLAPNQPPRVILDAVRNAPPDIMNLLLIDLTLHEGRVILAHPVNRLFRNHPQVKWVGRIHEFLTVPATQQRLTHISLIHDNARKRRQDASLRPETSQMYERGLKADACATPESPRPVFYLGNTLAERGDWAAALRAYGNYLELAGPTGWSEEVWQAHLNIAMCCSRLGDSAGCRKALLDAVAVDPRRSEAYLALGDCALDRGRVDEARIWYQFAATLPAPTSTIFVDVHAYGLKPWWKLGAALIRQKDYPSALAATERALQFAPQDPDVRERLEQLRFALLDEEESPTVVILSRSPELSMRCLEGMLRTEGKVYYETLLVCDGGTEPFEPLLKLFPRLRLVPGQEPFVYARNANLGIEACRGDVVLLNDDAVPQTPGWLDVLRHTARSRPDAGPVSPLLSQSGNVCQDARIAPSTPTVDPSGEEDACDSGAVTEAPFVTFVCVYLCRKILDSIGPLDPGFVWYGWEDNDYCRRAVSLGLRPLVSQKVLVRHDEPSASFRSPSQSRHFVQARHYFEHKHLRPPPSCDLLIRIPTPHVGAIRAIERLLAATLQDCRILVLSEGGDRAFIDALRDFEDPRLSLRFHESASNGAAALDELGAGRAEIVVEVDCDVILPEGWLEALLRGSPAEAPGLGVLALPLRGTEPSRIPARRLGSVELVPVSANDKALVEAPVRLVARHLLARFGPFGNSCVQLPVWHRLAQRLESRGHVNGIAWPLLGVEAMDVERAT